MDKNKNTSRKRKGENKLMTNEVGNTYQLFIEAIQKARKEKNISQRDMAQMLGISQAYYSKMEKSDSSTTFDFKMILSIINHLDLNVFNIKDEESIKDVLPMLSIENPNEMLEAMKGMFASKEDAEEIKQLLKKLTDNKE